MFWKDQLPHYLKLKLLSVHQIFCEILANILASLATSCLVPLGVPGLFSRSCAELLRDTLGGGLLRAESCDEDLIGVVAELELEASLEKACTRKGTQLSVLQNIFWPFI